MNNELAKEPELSEKFEELMQRIKNRDETKKCPTKNCST